MLNDLLMNQFRMMDAKELDAILADIPGLIENMKEAAPIYGPKNMEAFSAMCADPDMTVAVEVFARMIKRHVMQ